MSPNNPTICQFRIHNLKPPSLVQLLPSKRQPTSPKSGCSSSFWTAAIRRKPIPGSCSFGAFYGLPASASRKTRTDPSRTSSRKSRQSDSSTDEGGRGGVDSCGQTDPFPEMNDRNWEASAWNNWRIGIVYRNRFWDVPGRDCGNTSAEGRSDG